MWSLVEALLSWSHTIWIILYLLTAVVGEGSKEESPKCSLLSAWKHQESLLLITCWSDLVLWPHPTARGLKLAFSTFCKKSTVYVYHVYPSHFVE
jgi:hypothetical protein